MTRLAGAEFPSTGALSRFTTAVQTIILYAHGSGLSAAEICKHLQVHSPLYAGLGSADVLWLRGFLLESLARADDPDQGADFVFEELQSGQHPYLVAAACRALRSFRGNLKGAGPCLFQSLRNILGRDEAVSFEKFATPPPPSSGKTATQEILETLRWLGPRGSAVDQFETIASDDASGLPLDLRQELRATLSEIKTKADSRCCDILLPSASFLRRIKAAWSPSPLAKIQLQDQDGTQLTFKDFFTGRPAAIAFFYTRCDNPNKCSLTMSKLAELQRQLASRGLRDLVRLAAFTYDPEFDHPARLKRFGSDRGFAFGPGSRLFRTPNGLDELRDEFRLGVNFVGAIVNWHKIELYILDNRGSVVGSFERLHWNVSHVADELATLAHQPYTELAAKPLARLANALLSSLPAIGLALLPKCPMCLAAYLGVLGLGGLAGHISYPLTKVVFFSLLTVHFAWILRRAKITKRLEATMIFGIGASMLVAASASASRLLAFGGIAFIALASLLSSSNRKAASAVDYCGRTEFPFNSR